MKLFVSLTVHRGPLVRDRHLPKKDNKYSIGYFFYYIYHFFFDLYNKEN